MNQPILLGFGDSWTRGADLLPDEKPYIELMADQFQLPYFNFAEESSSIPHLIFQLKEFLETLYFPKNSYHAVFFLTAKERTFEYNYHTKELQHISPADPKHPYYRYYSKELGDFVLNTTVLALQQMCSSYNIQDYYVLGWQYNQIWPQVNHDKFWKHGFHPITQCFFDTEEERDLQNLLGLTGNPRNNCFGVTHDHPNQLGHEKIAQALCNWIDIK